MKDTIQPKNGEFHLDWNAKLSDLMHDYWDLLDGEQYCNSYEMLHIEDFIELIWNTSNIHFLNILTVGGVRLLLFKDVDTSKLYCTEIINA